MLYVIYYFYYIQIAHIKIRIYQCIVGFVIFNMFKGQSRFFKCIYSSPTVVCNATRNSPVISGLSSTLEIILLSGENKAVNPFNSSEYITYHRFYEEGLFIRFGYVSSMSNINRIQRTKLEFLKINRDLSYHSII